RAGKDGDPPGRAGGNKERPALAEALERARRDAPGAPEGRGQRERVRLPGATTRRDGRGSLVATATRGREHLQGVGRRRLPSARPAPDAQHRARVAEGPEGGPRRGPPARPAATGENVQPPRLPPRETTRVGPVGTPRPARHDGRRRGEGRPDGAGTVKLALEEDAKPQIA